MSSPCIVLDDRHPYALQMLKEIFKMSERDYDVLKLCSDGPLAIWQCHASRRRSARYLEEMGRLTWVFEHQRWEITETGRLVVDMAACFLSGYKPPVRPKAPVIEFPATFSK